MVGFIQEHILLGPNHPLARHVIARMKNDFPALIFNTPVDIEEENVEELNEFLTGELPSRIFDISGVTFGYEGFRTDYRLVVDIGTRHNDCQNFIIMPLMGGPLLLDTSEIVAEQGKMAAANLAFVFGWRHNINTVSPIPEPDDEVIISTNNIQNGIKYNEALKSYIKYIDGREVAAFDLQLGGYFGSMSSVGFTQRELIAILDHLGASVPKRKYPVYIHSKSGTKYAVLDVGGTKDGNTGESIVHYANVDTGVKFMHIYDEFFKNNEDGTPRFERTDDMIELSEEY